MASAVLEDAETALQATKTKRSNDDRAATHVSLSFLSGEKVNSGKIKSKVSQRLSINRKRLSNAYKHRVKTLRSYKSCCLFTERQKRSDSIPSEHRKLAYDILVESWHFQTHWYQERHNSQKSRCKNLHLSWKPSVGKNRLKRT